MGNLRVEIKWALIFTVVALLWMVFEKAMGWHGPKIDQHPIYTNFFALVAIAIYVFALRDKKQSLGGTMTWKQGFFAGVIISLIIMVLTPLSQYITHAFITPEYFPNAIAYAVDSENMTQEEAEQYFSMKNYIVQSAIFAPVVGIVTSAIVAIFVRSKN